MSVSNADLIDGDWKPILICNIERFSNSKLGYVAIKMAFAHLIACACACACAFNGKPQSTWISQASMSSNRLSILKRIHKLTLATDPILSMCVRN